MPGILFYVEKNAKDIKTTYNGRHIRLYIYNLA